MIRLRKILLQNNLYILILIFVLLITLIRVETFHTRKIKVPIISTIKSIYLEGDKLDIVLSNNIKGTYYIKSKENNLKIGDKVKVDGIISIPENPSTKNLFNYKNYLKSKKIYYLIKIKSIKKIKNTHNPLYIIKNFIQKRLNKNPYLYTFILGDKTYLNDSCIDSYQENGISHLFAISGMHITLLSSIILKLLKRLNEVKRYLIVSIILFIYLLLVGLSPSILRGVLFFYLFSINKIYYLYIKNTNIYILVLSITLLINPFYIYDTGFIYSFTISLSLLISNKYLTSNKYMIGLLKTSYISFISSIPISLYNYSSINILSIIYNLFYVPLISLIIFPMSLITLLIPLLDKPYNIMTSILEKTSIIISKINIGKIIFMRLHISYYILLTIIIFIIIYLNKHKYLRIIYIVLLIHFLLPNILSRNFIEAIDVGQGDSILMYSNNKSVLIDTGGVLGEKNSIVKYTTIPLLKSLGIKRINYLILTHGDYDHMGEAVSLVNKFKVEKVIFNCGEYNNLESELIKVLNKKKIKYYSCIEELNISKNKLYFLQTKDYGNENDNSNVIYTDINGYKLLFMGDASTTTEKEILDNYNLPDIDILKVGHHGSKTSSSIDFINTINPKYSIISVGENNRYNHPNKEALDNLSNSKIYRTDINGSIMFKIINNKLKIETCIP